MISVYQILLTDEDIVKVNARGFEAVPAMMAKTRMGLGFESSKFTEDYLQFYTRVYEVDTDDLDEAFEFTNLWEDEDKIRRFARGTSTSVGDIFVKDGDCHVVDTFGFVNIGKFEGMN